MESVHTELYRSTVGSVVLTRMPGGSQGPGWVCDEEHLVTNRHVVGEVDVVDVQFSRGESAREEVVGVDARADLAAVSVPPEDRPEYPHRSRSRSRSRLSARVPPRSGAPTIFRGR